MRAHEYLQELATSNMTTSVGAAEAGGFRSSKSPIPYLFGGLALMLTLIAVALLILACSFRKDSSSSPEKQSKTVDMDGEVNSEPKIVVIMAGDTNPTFLAKPLSSTATPSQQSACVKSPRDDKK